MWPQECRPHTKAVYEPTLVEFHSSEGLWVIFVSFSVVFQYFYTMLILLCVCVFFRSKVYKIREGLGGREVEGMASPARGWGGWVVSMAHGLSPLQESCGWKFFSPQCWASSSTGSSPGTRRKRCHLKMGGGDLGRDPQVWKTRAFALSRWKRQMRRST